MSFFENELQFIIQPWWQSPVCDSRIEARFYMSGYLKSTGVGF